MVIAVMSGKGGGRKIIGYLTSRHIFKQKRKESRYFGRRFYRAQYSQDFGLNHKTAKSGPVGILPEVTAGGIKVMSINLLMEQKDAPVIWRGPILSNTVKQFFYRGGMGQPGLPLDRFASGNR
jgi:hypothetical protein